MDGLWPSTGRISRIGVTGYTGLVGGAVTRHLLQAGYDVDGLGRRSSRLFDLDASVPSTSLEGLHGLIHCAYARKASASAEFESNVRGTERLLDVARAAGVGRVVIVSSMAARPGCGSLYGDAKRAIERLAIERGAVVVRPGLVWGGSTGLLHGMLKWIRRSPIVVCPTARMRNLALVHVDDLAAVLANSLATCEQRCIEVGHPDALSLVSLVRRLAKDTPGARVVIPVPYRLALTVLGLMERIPWGGSQFRADSLVGVCTCPPVGPLEEAPLGVQLRSFRLPYVYS